ncbi:MAG: DUF58 domain-containing protein [Hyphomonadaceae bacterium]|nr:DUF58 domain-containing protein [Hyphomonadaceae bacterium]MBC6413133.1 DUF58 domain-containing protein [Hyphomonadaceae bacterium]
MLTAPLHQRQEAESLAAGYPALLAEAERVAAVVAQGVHGRRRPGQGETFWQYRNYHSSDQANRIDWRRSARGDTLYVRDNEWEVANTIFFWRDGTDGMDWTSSSKFPTKKNRASVLCMALASLLMRAGERCAVIGESDHPRSGRAGLEEVSLRLAISDGLTHNLDSDIPAHTRLVLASDFLESPDVWQGRLAGFSARPAKGVLLRIIDPAEKQFPYKGRMQLHFPGLSSLPELVIGRAEKAREDYRKCFKAHGTVLSDMTRRLGWPLITHITDQPPNIALTLLFMALSGEQIL